jgi:GT2 family glycosyltransferase
MLARREAFAVVGGFDEALGLCEDIDWLARAKDAGVGAGSVDRVVLRYRIHAANTTSDTLGIQAGLLRVLRGSIRRQRASA